MIKVRVEKKPEFKVFGKKIWIGGTDENEAFGQFWRMCKSEGLLDKFWKLYQAQKKSVTKSASIGISCVEKNPKCRAFYFYIATECEQSPEGLKLEEYIVPAVEWAIFENCGSMPMALVDAEMYAFQEWLPNSGYIHANAPELEVYPVDSDNKEGTLVEFWLPLCKQQINM